MTQTKEQEAQLDIGIAKAARILWATLDEARPFKDKSGKENGKPKYSATLFLPNDSAELKAHKDAVVSLLKAKYGAKLSFSQEEKAFYAEVDGRKMKLALPFHNGDEEVVAGMSTGKDRSFCAGGMLIKTSSQYPVPCFDARKRDSSGNPAAVTDKEAIKATFYSGCFGAATIKYRTYDKVGSNPPGVTAYLQKACFVHDGDRIASGANSSNFAQVQGAVTEYNPTDVAADDEISY